MKNIANKIKPGHEETKMSFNTAALYSRDDKNKLETENNSRYFMSTIESFANIRKSARFRAIGIHYTW